MKTILTSLIAFLMLSHVVNAQAIQKTVLQNTYSTNFKMMSSADLNNDGVKDMIGADGAITWYQGTGENSIGTRHVIVSEFTGDINKFSFIDLNEDGWMDLFFETSDDDKSMGWLENPGTGTDTWTVHEMPGLYSNLIGFFDIDGDEDRDFVYEDNLTYLGWRENVDNNFSLAHTLPDSYSDLTFSATSDFDQDGDIDWVAYFYDCCTKYFSNNSNGTFTVTMPSSSECVKPAIITDVNTDGYIDIVYFYSTFQTSIFSPLSNTFSSPSTIGDIDNYIGMDVCDLDGDTDLDWIIKTEVGYLGEDYYRINGVVNNGTGFEPDSAFALIPGVSDESEFYSFMDLNNDNQSDFFISDENANLEFYENNFPEFASAQQIELENNPKIDDIICFDIDGDPDNDLVLANVAGGLNWFEYNHVMDSFMIMHSVLSLNDYPIPTNIKKKDIDGDTDFDLVVSYNEADGYPEVTYYCLNDGDGNFTNYELDNIAFDNVWFVDGNADGLIDLIAMDSDSPNDMLYYKNTGDSLELFDYSTQLTSSGTWYSFITFDVDNDGDDDFVGAKSGSTWLQKIVNTDGAAGFNSPANFVNCACSNIYSVFTADFDNDTDMDLMYTCSTGATYLLTNSGGTFTSTGIGTFDATLLSDGSHTGVFDLNGDGFKDLHYNKTSGGSGYKLSTGPGTFDESFDYFSEDYGRFGYVDDGSVVDFIGTNNHELYIQYNIVLLAPSYSVSYPTRTWLEENGESDSVTFVFDVIPESELTIQIIPSGSIDAGAGEGVIVELHFPADSSALIPQTVTWHVPDDALVEDVTGSSLQISADPYTWGMYTGLINETYIYTIADNDLGLFASGNELIITEGVVADTIYAHFNMIPDEEIILQITPDAAVNFGFDAAITETFTLPAGFEGLTHFKMTATPPEEDFYAEENIFAEINLEIISEESVFDDFIPELIAVQLNDNDFATIETIYPAVSISEGVELFQASVTITSAPYSDITITAFPNLQIDLGEGPGMPLSVTIIADGSLPETLTLEGIAYNDFLVEGAHTGYVTFTITTDDPDYASLIIPDLIINIDDNDAAQGINISVPAEDIYLEGSTGLEINLSLFTNPNELVTIYATPDAQINLGGGAGVSVPILFDIYEDATADHLIPVTIAEDYIVEGDHTGTITFEIVTLDPMMSGITIDDITIQIQDNDEEQGVTILYPAATDYLEATTGLEISLSLFTIPNEAVTIFATPDAQLDLGAGAGIPISILFNTTDEALVPQILNCAIVDDDIAEGDHNGVISYTIETTDPQFVGYVIDDANILINDYDDMQGVNLIAPALDIYLEGTTGIELSLALLLDPLETVTITATPDAQLDLGAGPGIAVPVTFEGVGATEPHLLALTIFDDYIFEDDHTGTISFTIETTDPGFEDYTIADIIINIDDDDEEQGVELNYPWLYYFVEGTTGIALDIWLLAEPNNIVTVHVIPDIQLDLGNGAGVETTISFVPGTDVTIPITVPVAIVDDLIVEDEHWGTVLFSFETDDPQFVGYAIPSIAFNISDNDEETDVQSSAENNISIYPTSGNGMFSIQTENINEALQVSIVNMTGQLIAETELNASGTTQIDLTSAPQGNYMMLFKGQSTFETVPVQIVK